LEPLGVSNPFGVAGVVRTTETKGASSPLFDEAIAAAAIGALKGGVVFEWRRTTWEVT
jgi:hypothetical protein